jgi:uncharacterized protein involved in exopolysaccharide biosynthesis
LPAPTHSELIRQLDQAVTRLTERGVGLREEIMVRITHLDTGLTRTTDTLRQAEQRLETRLAALEGRVAVLEGRFEDFKKQTEEAERKRWSLLVPLVATFTGSILALIAQIVLLLIRK